MQTEIKLRRVQIREILKRHPGSIGEVAERLGVSKPMISKWLYGSTTSRRVAEALHAKALDLLAQEEAQRQHQGAA